MKNTLRLLVLVSIIASLGVGCAKKEAMDNAIEGTSVEQSTEITVEEATEPNDSEEVLPAEEPNIDMDTDETSAEEDGTDETTEE